MQSQIIFVYTRVPKSQRMTFLFYIGLHFSVVTSQQVMKQPLTVTVRDQRKGLSNKLISQTRPNIPDKVFAPNFNPINMQHEDNLSGTYFPWHWRNLKPVLERATKGQGSNDCQTV